jgi:hypothetical protein
MLQKFIDKETAINKAIERVNNKLQYFNETPDLPHLDWNKWHDLHDRLQDRLIDNWSNFKEWHFIKFNFNTY